MRRARVPPGVSYEGSVRSRPEVRAEARGRWEWVWTSTRPLVVSVITPRDADVDGGRVHVSRIGGAGKPPGTVVPEPSPMTGPKCLSGEVMVLSVAGFGTERQERFQRRSDRTWFRRAERSVRLTGDR